MRSRFCGRRVCRDCALAHSPRAVPFHLDYRGASLVKSYEEDRELAVKIAKHLRPKLHAARLSIVSAVQKERCSDGTLIGEHDLVLEEVGEEFEEGPEGLVSAEIKCRRLYSEAGRTRVRAELRREADWECDGWQRAISKRDHTWRGRMSIFGHRQWERHLLARGVQTH